MRLTPNEALAIQARHIQHYGPMHPRGEKACARSWRRAPTSTAWISTSRIRSPRSTRASRAAGRSRAYSASTWVGRDMHLLLLIVLFILLRPSRKR